MSHGGLNLGTGKEKEKGSLDDRSDNSDRTGNI